MPNSGRSYRNTLVLILVFTVKSKSELYDRSWIGFVVGLRNACV